MKRRRGKGSSKDERDELARGRRERARRARSDLAAKAKGEEPEGGEGVGEGPAEGAKQGEGKPKLSAAERKRAERRAARERLLGGAQPGAVAKPKPAPGEGRQDAEERPSAKDERRKSPVAKDDRRDTPAAKDERRDTPAAKDERRPKRRAGGGRRRRAASAGEEPAKPSEPKRKRRQRAAKDGERPREPVKAGGPASEKGERGKPSRRRGERAEGTGAARKRAKEQKRRRPGAAKRSAAGAKRAGRGALVALKRGGAETHKRARGAGSKAGALASRLLSLAARAMFIGLGFIFGIIVVAYRRIAPPVRKGLRLARHAIDAVSRQVTPIRVFALVVAGAAVLLALSQFAVYRSISIGTDAYADGIQTIAPAPVRETADTGSAHSYLMVPLAAAALVLLGAALTGRWRLCRLIALIGLVAIAVGLLHDRPTGLDVGEEATAFTGVAATLLGGFYAQLFAGLLLTLSSLLLSRELRAVGSESAARAPRRSGAGRRLLRRGTGAEGARA